MDVESNWTALLPVGINPMLAGRQYSVPQRMRL